MIRRVEVSKQTRKVKETKIENVLPTTNENSFRASTVENGKQTIDCNKLKDLIADRDRDICSLNEKIKELQKKEKDLTASLSEKDLNVLELKQKLDSQDVEGIKWKDMLSEKDRNICSLKEKIKVLQKKENDLTASLSKKERCLFELEQRLDFRKEVEISLKDQLTEKDKHIEKLKSQIDLGGSELDCLPFNRADKQNFENLVKYVHGIDTNPQGVRIRAKCIERAIKKIVAYGDNSDKLIKICKYVVINIIIGHEDKYIHSYYIVLL